MILPFLPDVQHGKHDGSHDHIHDREKLQRSLHGIWQQKAQRSPHGVWHPNVRVENAMIDPVVLMYLACSSQPLVVFSFKISAPLLLESLCNTYCQMTTCIN